MQNKSENLNAEILLAELKKDIEYLGKTTQDGFSDLRSILLRHECVLYGKDGTGGLVSEVAKIKDNQGKLGSIQAGFTTIVGFVVLFAQKYIKW